MKKEERSLWNENEKPITEQYLYCGSTLGSCSPPAAFSRSAFS